MIVNTKMFFLKVIVLQFLIQILKSDCGRPGLTFGSYYIQSILIKESLNYEDQPKIYPEDSQVTYACRETFELIGLSYPIHTVDRTCKKGKWTGRAPKCGNL